MPMELVNACLASFTGLSEVRPGIEANACYKSPTGQWISQTELVVIF